MKKEINNMDAINIIHDIINNKLGIEDINESIKKLETDYSCSVDDFIHIYTTLLDHIFYNELLDNIVYYYDKIIIDDKSIRLSSKSLNLYVYYSDLHDTTYPEIILDLFKHSKKKDFKDTKEGKFYINMTREQFIEIISFINEYFLRNKNNFRNHD